MSEELVRDEETKLYKMILADRAWSRRGSEQARGEREMLGSVEDAKERKEGCGNLLLNAVGLSCSGSNDWSDSIETMSQNPSSYSGLSIERRKVGLGEHITYLSFRYLLELHASTLLQVYIDPIKNFQSQRTRAACRRYSLSVSEQTHCRCCSILAFGHTSAIRISTVSWLPSLHSQSYK